MKAASYNIFFLHLNPVTCYDFYILNTKDFGSLYIALKGLMDTINMTTESQYCEHFLNDDLLTEERLENNSQDSPGLEPMCL